MRIVPNEFGSISDLNLRFVTNIYYEFLFLKARKTSIR